MYVCMYVCIYIYIYTHTYISYTYRFSLTEKRPLFRGATGPTETLFMEANTWLRNGRTRQKINFVTGKKKCRGKKCTKTLFMEAKTPGFEMGVPGKK